MLRESIYEIFGRIGSVRSIENDRLDRLNRALMERPSRHAMRAPRCLWLFFDDSLRGARRWRLDAGVRHRAKTQRNYLRRKAH